MKYLDLIPYHKVLEHLESSNFRSKKQIRIYTLCNFNLLVLNKYIDTFLLSCRILGRKVENFLFYELLKKLKQKKVNFVEEVYIKTKKNNFFKIKYV